MLGPACSNPAAGRLSRPGVLESGAGDVPLGLLESGAITVSFHPDRLLADGSSVAQRLAAEGRYRSQFETGISNGGLTAYAGGDRDVWERRMFAGAYPSSVTVDRPIYGGLNLAGYPDGASPRFGSCHLILDPAVARRTTFSHGDSVTEPTVVGTADTFGGIWAALLDEVARTGTRPWIAGRRPGRVGGRARCAPHGGRQVPRRLRRGPGPRRARPARGRHGRGRRSVLPRYAHR